jgi:hypothetical protein
MTCAPFILDPEAKALFEIGLFVVPPCEGNSDFVGSTWAACGASCAIDVGDGVAGTGVSSLATSTTIGSVDMRKRE